MAQYAESPTPSPVPPCMSAWITRPPSGSEHLPEVSICLLSQLRELASSVLSTAMYSLACLNELITNAVSLKSQKLTPQ